MCIGGGPLGVWSILQGKGGSGALPRNILKCRCEMVSLMAILRLKNNF